MRLLNKSRAETIYTKLTEGSFGDEVGFAEYADLEVMEENFISLLLSRLGVDEKYSQYTTFNRFELHRGTSWTDSNPWMLVDLELDDSIIFDIIENNRKEYPVSFKLDTAGDLTSYSSGIEIGRTSGMSGYYDVRAYITLEPHYSFYNDNENSYKIKEAEKAVEAEGNKVAAYIEKVVKDNYQELLNIMLENEYVDEDLDESKKVRKGKKLTESEAELEFDENGKQKIFYFIVGICLDENRPNANEEDFYDMPDFGIPYKLLDENFGVTYNRLEALRYTQGYIKDGVPGTFGAVIETTAPEGVNVTQTISAGWADWLEPGDVYRFKEENGGKLIFCAYSGKGNEITTLVGRMMESTVSSKNKKFGKKNLKEATDELKSVEDVDKFWKSVSKSSVSDGELEKLKTELKNRADDLSVNGDISGMSKEDIDILANRIKQKGFFISNNIFADDSDEYEWEQINMFLDSEIRNYVEERDKADAEAEAKDQARDRAFDYERHGRGSKEQYEKDLDTLRESWTEVDSKSVQDSDGFTTDYTMYKDENGKYVFVFGDKDLYKPEEGYFDWEAESEAEAREWFDSYNGFSDLNESASEYDSVGSIQEIDGKKYYVSDDTFNGSCYKSARAYNNNPDKVCYICEFVFQDSDKLPVDEIEAKKKELIDDGGVSTKNSIKEEIKAALEAEEYNYVSNSGKKIEAKDFDDGLFDFIADDVFNMVDWQSTSAFIGETDWSGAIEEYYSKNSGGLKEAAKPKGYKKDDSVLTYYKSPRGREYYKSDIWADYKDRKPYKVFVPGDRVIIAHGRDYDGTTELEGKTGTIISENFIGNYHQFGIEFDIPLDDSWKTDTWLVGEDVLEFYEGEPDPNYTPKESHRLDGFFESAKEDKKSEEKRVVMQQGNVTCFKESKNKYLVFENESDNEKEYDNQDSAMADFMERVGVDPNAELKEAAKNKKKSLTEITKYGDTNPDEISQDAYLRFEDRGDQGTYVDAGIGDHTSLGGGFYKKHPEGEVSRLYNEVRSRAKEKGIKIHDKLGKSGAASFDEIIPRYNSDIEQDLKDLEPYKDRPLKRRELDDIIDITGRRDASGSSERQMKHRLSGEYGKLGSKINNLNRNLSDIDRDGTKEIWIN